MFEDIKKKIPLLENQDEMIGFILDVREAFNAKDIPFKVTIGKNHVGNIDKYLDNLKRPCRCVDCLNKRPHGESDKKRRQIERAINRRKRRFSNY